MSNVKKYLIMALRVAKRQQLKVYYESIRPQLLINVSTIINWGMNSLGNRNLTIIIDSGH